MKNRFGRVGAVGLASLFAVGIGSAYLVGRARASGAPQAQPLTYSGVLTDTAGAPLSGSKNIQVQIWDKDTAGNIVCTTPSAPQTLVAGNFSVSLPAPCVAAVRTTPDLWTEVLVDGASVGRVKIGAVPYALEADTASNAAGALAAKLATIPTLQVGRSGYVACTALKSFAAAGYNNLLIRAQIFSDAGCTNDVTAVTCHPWCASLEVASDTFSATCCGVDHYYTKGVVDVLQWK